MLKTIITTYIICIPIFVFAQEHNWQVRSSVAGIDMFNSNSKYGTQWKAQGDYSFSEYLEGGIFYGFSNNEFNQNHFYGLGANFQLLPLFVDSENLRLQLYTRLEVGGTSSSYKAGLENFNLPRSSWMGSFGIGMSYFLWSSFGFYLEFDELKLFNEYDTRWQKIGRLGFVVSF